MNQPVLRIPRFLPMLVPLVLLVGCTSTPAPQAAPPPAAPAPAVAPAPSAPSTPVAARGPAEPLRNTIRWKTASEVDNFGFDVYRATAEDGPFERLTSSPVPGAGTVDEPKSYQFADEKIEPGVAYWYYVESISIQGVREKFTPTFKAPVKTGAPAPAPKDPPSPR